MFEIVYSDNTVVISYNYEGLVLLGIYDLKGHEKDYEYLVAFADQLNHYPENNENNNNQRSKVILPPAFSGKLSQCLEKLQYKTTSLCWGGRTHNHTISYAFSHLKYRWSHQVSRWK